MSSAISHWGYTEDSGADGSYEIARQRPSRTEADVVLTEAGEVLIRRNCQRDTCCVAIVIGRDTSGLSRPQSERMQRAWDMAVAVANGNSLAIDLQPVPHHWRFARAEYLTIEEWRANSLAAEAEGATFIPDDRDAQQ